MHVGLIKIINCDGFMLRLLFAVIFYVLFPFSQAIAHEDNQSDVKDKLLVHVFGSSMTTFYCGCEYQKSQDKTYIPVFFDCGYEPRKRQRRAKRIELEHIVPVSKLSAELSCWRSGGRDACIEDSQYQAMATDLHNLVPAIGEINADRSAYEFAMIEGESRSYGRCDFEVDFKNRLVEPAPNIRGDIARIYFYMSNRYGVKLSTSEKTLFSKWDLDDPLDAHERKRNEIIIRIQGY